MDRLREKLCTRGEKERCGWLKDRSGGSWQIAPAEPAKLIPDKASGRSGRIMQALLKMKKIDIAALKKACGGKR